MSHIHVSSVLHGCLLKVVLHHSIAHHVHVAHVLHGGGIHATHEVRALLLSVALGGDVAQGGLLAALIAARVVDVPELEPPVLQEGTLGVLEGWVRQVLGSVGVVVIVAVGLILALAGRLLGLGEDLHGAGLMHGARNVIVLVAEEVVVDVCVQALDCVEGIVGGDGTSVWRACIAGVLLVLLVVLLRRRAPNGTAHAAHVHLLRLAHV